jgi:hypothetical protein
MVDICMYMFLQLGITKLFLRVCHPLLGMAENTEMAVLIYINCYPFRSL